MLKSTICAVLLTLAVSNAVASEPHPEEQKANFATCAKNDESWMRRFGNYVIAFELAPAYDFCRTKANHRPFAVRRAGCRVEGNFIRAGYYCE